MEIGITQVLRQLLQMHPQRILTVCGERRRRVHEVADRVARFAGALRQLGVMPDERVGILALNSDRYIESLLAVPWAGGALNPCNVRWTAPEIAYSLNDCDTRVLIVDDHFAPLAAGLRDTVPGLRHLIHAGDGATPQGMRSYEALLAQAQPVADALRKGSDLLGIFYTGGTTGFPKGVLVSHEGFWVSALSLIAEGVIPRQSVMLRSAPMFHMADLAYGYCGLLQQCTHVILPAFHAARVAAAIAAERAEVALFVPTMLQLLLNEPDVERFDFSSLKSLIYAASPIADATVVEVMRRWPRARLTQVYGQTELSPVGTVLHHESHADPVLRRSAGCATHCVELRIADAEGTELPRGQVGEIVARGPNVMQGYWNKPDATAAAFTREGWLRTGDGAYMDETGHVFIVDRIKDMIVTGGENVFSGEVENALATHPAVAMCAVIAIPSDEWGEAVHAVVVLRPSMAVDAAQLIEHCRERIAGYKCPHSVEFRTALPVSGAGKILKRDLRAPFWEGRERRVA
ncbi:MAG TPA: long-chain-fatty-acid--CoA ligase [Burkholderiaceae bacterium]|jgi:long-chain acyl-CoA synthetase|nr:long-chain-fatty-acid--CoA ligase [Burkholderiaceae bacterium]